MSTPLPPMRADIARQPEMLAAIQANPAPSMAAMIK